jgi:hypothetical protein
MTNCKPIANGDYVHVSSGQASGHGWWTQGTCTDPYATVAISLQELWTSDGTWHGGYGPNSSTERPGSGSATRVTAKQTCKDTSKRYWRSVVSVVLEDGSSDTTTTDKQYIACRA